MEATHKDCPCCADTCLVSDYTCTKRIEHKICSNCRDEEIDRAIAKERADYQSERISLTGCVDEREDAQ